MESLCSNKLQLSVDVSYHVLRVILYVIYIYIRVPSAHSLATSLFVSYKRKKKNTRKWSCWSIRRLLIVDPSGNQFLRIRRMSFYIDVWTRRYHPRPIIDPSKACESYATTCSDLFFGIIDIFGHFDYATPLQNVIGVMWIFLRPLGFIKSLWSVEITSL